jgi:hypothetical protein
MLDLTGQRFGLLTVVSIHEKTPKGPKWLCHCDCGGSISPRYDALLTGRAKSCGCSRKRHGNTGVGWATPEYKSWAAMIARCCVPSNGMHHRYGAKGITVCERWRTFENFLADMGPKPTLGHSIERENNSKGYLPDNCRWATRTEQQRNRTNTRTLTIDGVTKPQTQWAEDSGTPISRIKSRLAMGWSAKEAVFAPLKIVRRG